MITIRALVLLVLCCFINTAGAAQYVDYRGYRIHYATFSSMIIPAEVAVLHEISRAENRIVLNLSIVRDDSPADGAVSGHVTNLLNQRFELDFSEIREADAIYYLASHTALEEDILRFELSVSPGSEKEPVTIDFLRRYD